MLIKQMICVKNFLKRNSIVIVYITMCLLTIGFNVFATEDMWTAATRIIKDVYKQIKDINKTLLILTMGFCSLTLRFIILYLQGDPSCQILHNNKSRHLFFDNTYQF